MGYDASKGVEEINIEPTPYKGVRLIEPIPDGETDSDLEEPEITGARSRTSERLRKAYMKRYGSDVETERYTRRDTQETNRMRVVDDGAGYTRPLEEEIKPIVEEEPLVAKGRLPMGIRRRE
jgi:hypothetical protein